MQSVPQSKTKFKLFSNKFAQVNFYTDLWSNKTVITTLKTQTT